MAYKFFFSYKRVSKTPYQRRFFDDLSTELRDLLEYPKDTPVGFFDQTGIEPGEEWGSAIANALQESKVMVCVYSPKYFESEYCGKEWQVFDMRRRKYQLLQQAAGDVNAPLPLVIKPVLWLPLPEDLNPEFTKFQLFKGTREDVANREGLLWVLKRRTAFRKLYTDYINQLARDIIEAAERNLPPLPDLPPLAEIPSAFARPEELVVESRDQVELGVRAGQSSEVAQVEVLSIQESALPQPDEALPIEPPDQTQFEPPLVLRPSVNIRFVFVAGNPAKFGPERQPQAYLQRGGPDWRPFYPTPADRIARIIQRFVADEDVEYDMDIVPLGDDLISVVRQAYENREIVVIIVDAWTLSWDSSCRNILSEFDARNMESPFYNCSVLVPWNDADLELKDRRDKLFETVRETFYSRVKLFNNPVFYRDSITSVNDLLDALRDALTNIRTELHGRAAGQKPVAAGISKPIVSNTTNASTSTGRSI